MRIYVDLDHTLGFPIERKGQLVGFKARPWADWFLRTLSRHGDPWLLTSAELTYAEHALRAMGSSSRRLKGILSREDLRPIRQQMDLIIDSPIPHDEKERLFQEIRPIAPQGVIFDDYQVGSEMFVMKSVAVGVGAEAWVEVEVYAEAAPDRNGLRKAYEEFRRRFLVGHTIGAPALA